MRIIIDTDLVEQRGECWEWVGKRNWAGYGYLPAGASLSVAYRLVVALRDGQLPKRPFGVNHVCSNRACIRPEHLEIVTQKDNVRHGLLTKLSPESVRKIRELRKFGHSIARIQKEIASQFKLDIGSSTISRVIVADPDVRGSWVDVQ